MGMLLVSIATIVLAMPVAADQISAPDRQRLLAHLAMTGSWLEGEVAGLTPAQQTYRPAPGTWRVLDVVEHLAVAEPQYWQMVQDSMAQPPSAAGISATDADILWYGIDRTRRDRTGDPREPKGRYKDVPFQPSLQNEFLDVRRNTVILQFDIQQALGTEFVEHIGQQRNRLTKSRVEPLEFVGVS